MEFTRLIAGADDQGKRVDVVVRKLLSPGGGGLSPVYQALRTGLVRVNGKKAAPGLRLTPGDEVAIALVLGAPQRAALKSTAPGTGAPQTTAPAAFEVLFQNEHLRVVNKPAGLSSQDPALRAFLAAPVPASTAPSLAFTPAPLHRLDKLTTGCLVCSQSILGARWFSAALQEHRIGKTYLGVASGALTAPVSWTDILDTPAPARTTATPLAPRGNATVVQYDISTGQKHQIRRQSALHGFPLVGDVAYGGPLPPPFLLHAWKVCFPPDNPLGMPPLVMAPVPAGFGEVG
jgi:23S rRNA pseudouridine955/2504/2580 synthase